MAAQRLKRLLLALASAALLALAQMQPAFWALAAVSLVPWLVASRAATRFETVFLGALVGTLSTSLVVSWIPEALRALGSSPATALTGLVVTTAWAKAPLFAATGLLARELRRAWFAPLVLAAFFGCGEAWISASAWGVPGALLGHSQLPATGVSQLALIGGVPLISAWLVALNAGIALALSGARHAMCMAGGIAAGWLAMALFGLEVAGAVRPEAPPGRPATFLVVQPEIPRHARWIHDAQPWVLEQIAAETTKGLASGTGVDAIVWPENLLTTPLEAAPELSSELERLVDAWNTPLITGLVRRSAEGRMDAYRSSIVWVEPSRGITAAIDKAQAVPLLESSRAIPGGRWLDSLFGQAARGHKVEEAEASGSSALAGPVSLAPVLCYEVLFPGIAAERRLPGSLAILNLADDSWVRGDVATRQLATWGAFRAIEQRLTLIRVAHGGLTTVVDEFGRKRTALPQGRFAHTRVTVQPSAPPSFFEKLMVSLVALLPALVVWCLLLAMNRQGVLDVDPNAVSSRWRALRDRSRERRIG